MGGSCPGGLVSILLPGFCAAVVCGICPLEGQPVSPDALLTRWCSAGEGCKPWLHRSQVELQAVWSANLPNLHLPQESAAATVPQEGAVGASSRGVLRTMLGTQWAQYKLPFVVPHWVWPSASLS